MKTVKWGIEGYLVIYANHVIGQFDNVGWAWRFQEMVAKMNPGKAVTIIYDEGHSTCVMDKTEEPKP